MKTRINIFAEIKGIRYTPLMCRELNTYSLEELEEALQRDSAFVLRTDGAQLGMSRWVSPKRTRSYPYARVYDSLQYSKRLTLIPVMKDEGKDGDRDFLQWDTVSLMSLLNVPVIISYYASAEKDLDHENKITNQRFEINHVKSEILRLLDYQSDALHWNMDQLDKVGIIAENALTSYKKISEELGVEMHSEKSAKRRIKQLLKGKENFMKISRELAKAAQKRETVTVQPKEYLEGTKGTITIKNFLGGYYFFTCDEFEIHGKDLYLIEGKHTEAPNLPSLDDIKDGLLKMILYTNLSDVKIDENTYNPVPVLKLTTGSTFDERFLGTKDRQTLESLRKEAEKNNFRILINDRFLI